MVPCLVCVAGLFPLFRAERVMFLIVRAEGCPRSVCLLKRCAVPYILR